MESKIDLMECFPRIKDEPKDETRDAGTLHPGLAVQNLLRKAGASMLPWTKKRDIQRPKTETR